MDEWSGGGEETLVDHQGCEQEEEDDGEVVDLQVHDGRQRATCRGLLISEARL